jgi:hypothetical protein
VVFAALLALGLVICKARLDGQKQWPVLFLYNLPINFFIIELRKGEINKQKPANLIN